MQPWSGLVSHFLVWTQSTLPEVGVSLTNLEQFTRDDIEKLESERHVTGKTSPNTSDNPFHNSATDENGAGSAQVAA